MEILAIVCAVFFTTLLKLKILMHLEKDQKVRPRAVHMISAPYFVRQERVGIALVRYLHRFNFRQLGSTHLRFSVPILTFSERK